jgi:hypothetical protein
LQIENYSIFISKYENRTVNGMIRKMPYHRPRRLIRLKSNPLFKIELAASFFFVTIIVAAITQVNCSALMGNFTGILLVRSKI